MSPVRKSDDYRSTEIKSWDEYIEEEIIGMEARGEMKDLPQQGKPIKIWKTDVNPEYDLAFSRLKNAGVKPLWMELDQEIGKRTDELWARLDTVEQLIRTMLDRLVTPVDPEPHEQERLGPWQRFQRWFRADFREEPAPLPTITDVMATRERERTKFLDLAAELDKRIREYHDSLPKGAEHLQRLRWLPERAARVFDERIALTAWWEEVRAERA